MKIDPIIWEIIDGHVDDGRPLGARRPAQPTPVYRCGCCGETYRRGSWSCCGPRTGQRSDRWLPQWCSNATTEPGRRMCPRHCPCAVCVERRAPSPPASREAVERVRARAQTDARGGGFVQVGEI